MAISKKTRVAVYKKFDGHCAYCGRHIAYNDMQVDHFKPQRAWNPEDSGTDDIENLMLENPKVIKFYFEKVRDNHAADCPTIDLESLRHTAHWIKCDLIKVEHVECTRYRNAGIECSKCNHVYDKFALWDGTFCPGCGSRMIDCEDGERR